MKRKQKTVRKKTSSRGPARRCCIAAMGASAGGLEVFQEFFDRMPEDSGMAFVLIQHLDPHHETLMPELLTKHTKMPVVEIKDGMSVEPNCVFVIPPNAFLEMDGCLFRLKAMDLQATPKAIDTFFCSVAADQ